MLTSLAERQMTNSAAIQPVVDEPETPRLKFYAPTVLGPMQRMTPEGFLVCEDVQIARTGELLYVPGEIAATNGQEPLQAGRDGLIHVQRDEAEVFNPLTIASFLGKPVTIDHPDDDVTPDNWRSYAVGVVVSVRRGEGALSEYLLADLLIQEASAIAAIRGGKREISCGYDADYEAIEPGIARQFGIIGNHVALVEKGRCGPRCAVRDSNPNPSEENSMAKRTTWDRIRTAFKAKDEAAFEEEMQAAMEASGNDGDNIQRLVIEVKQPEAVDVTTDEDPDAAAEPTGLEAVMKGLADLSAQLQAFGTRLDAIEGNADDGDTNDDAEELEKKDDEDDGKKKTGDSAALQIEFTQTLARAEILAPGVKLPTFDAKADKKKTADSMCALRRKALGVAFKDDAMRKHLTPFVTKDSADFTKMTCDAVTMAFNGASELAKIANNGETTQRKTNDSSFTDTASQISNLNKRNADFWSRK